MQYLNREPLLRANEPYYHFPSRITRYLLRHTNLHVYLHLEGPPLHNCKWPSNFITFANTKMYAVLSVCSAQTLPAPHTHKYVTNPMSTANQNYCFFF